MRKPITKKYYIESVLADSFSSKIEVSASKFNAALKDAEKKFADQEAEEDDEFYIERMETQFESETLTESNIAFTWGCSSIYFSVVACKEGYRFTK